MPTFGNVTVFGRILARSVDVDPPAWVTPSGNLGVFVEGSFYSVTLTAVDDFAIGSYVFGTGSLPVGASLGIDGVISGTLASVTTRSTYPFSVLAYDRTGHYAERNFGMIVRLANPPPEWVSPGGNLGTITEGNLFAYTFIATDDTAVASYSISGTIPAGLTLNATSGVLSGSIGPAATASFPFNVIATDNLGSDTPLSNTLYIRNIPPSWVAPLAGSLGTYNEGDLFSATFSATDNIGPVSYAISAGTAPPGLVLNAGVLSGSFSNLRGDTVFDFTISASDGYGQTNRTFSINVLDVNTPPVWTTPAGAFGPTISGGETILATLVAVDDKMISGYAVIDGALPAGLGMNGYTGVISGVVGAISTADKQTFVVRAEDGQGLFTLRTFWFSQVNQAPVWITPAGNLGTFNERINISVNADVRDTQSLSFSLVAGSLPAATNISQSGPGSVNISGFLNNLDVTTTFTFTLRASDGVLSTDRDFALTVVEVNTPPVFNVTSIGFLNDLYEGTTYIYTLAATDDKAGVTHSIVGGTLPPGLNFNPATAVLSGTLSAIVNEVPYSFAIQATDVEGLAVSQTYAGTLRNVAPRWITGGPIDYYENDLVSFTLSAYDLGSLTYSVVGTLPYSLTLVGNVVTGSLPSINVIGSENTLVTFRASDGGKYTDQQMWLYVRDVNTPPVWITPSGSSLGTIMGGDIVRTAIAGIDDKPDWRYFSDMFNPLPVGLTLDPVTGSIYGTVGAITTSAQHTFKVNLQDSQGSTAIGTFWFDQINTAPIWSTPAGSVGAYGERAGIDTRVFFATDVQPILTYSLVDGSLPSGVQVVSDGRLYGAFPEVSYIGTQTFNFVVGVSDGALSSNRTFSLDLYDINSAPQFNNFDGIFSAYEGDVVNYTLSVSDDKSVALIEQIGGSIPAGLTMSTLGVFTGTVAATIVTANRTVILRATDNEGLSTIRTHSIYIMNRAPVFTVPPQSFVLNEGATLAPFTFAATDLSPITYSMAPGYTLPAGFTLTGNVLSGVAPEKTTPGQAGYGLWIRASDGELTADQSFAIYINDLNTPPVWVTPAGSIGTITGGGTEVVNFTFAAIDDKTVALYQIAGGALPTGLNLAADGRLTGTIGVITAAPTQQFVVRAYDNEGSITDRTFWYDQINYAPAWVSPSTNIGTLTERAYYQMTLVATDMQVVRYSLASGALPAGMGFAGFQNEIIYGNVSEINVPTLTGTFVIDATDGYATSSCTFNFTVIDVNTPPVWSTSSQTYGPYTSGATLNITLSATDDKAGLIYSIASGSLPANIMLGSTTGVISGTLGGLTIDYITTFAVAATDIQAAAVIRTFALNLVNSEPAWASPAAGLIANVTEGATYTTTLVATDYEAVSYSLVGGTLPAGFSISDNILGGVAPLVNTDTLSSFTIRATDGFKTADRAFSINVIDVNSAPVFNFVGNLGTYDELTSVTLSVAATDDKSVASYELISGSIPGTMTLNTLTGTLIGTFSNIVSGTVTSSFVIRATDGQGVSSLGTFSVSVRDLPNPPVWQTPANLGTYQAGILINNTVVATDDVTLTGYSVVPGSTLPAGFTFNGTTGAIRGETPVFSTDTDLTFPLRAIDDAGAVTDRTFTLRVLGQTITSFVANRGLRRRMDAGQPGEGGRMSWTPSRARSGDGTKYTYSAWLKLPKIDGDVHLLGDPGGAINNYFTNSGTNRVLLIGANAIGVGTFNMRTQDTTGWFHLVITFDTTQPVQSDRVRVFLNGGEVTSKSTISLNQNQTCSAFASGFTWSFFNFGTEAFITNLHCLDGIAASATAFGRANPTTGVWEPIVYTGSYGNNGFYLPMNTTSPGTDSSGNGNNWTVTAFSLSDSNSRLYDLLLDSPSGGDYTTPVTPQYNSILSRGGATEFYCNGNGSFWTTAFTSIGARTGQRYFEVKSFWNSVQNQRFGISTGQESGEYGADSTIAGFYGVGESGGSLFRVTNGTRDSTAITTFALNDILSIAVDHSAGKLWVAKNNAYLASGNPATGANPLVTFPAGQYMVPAMCIRGGANHFIEWHAGQNGFWNYGPPFGFSAYTNTALTAPTITRPTDFMDSATYTGTGTSQSVSFSFQPSILWVKNRSTATPFAMFDSAQGAGNYTQMGTTNAAASDNQSVTAFNSNGFSVGTSSVANASGGSYAAMAFRASAAAGIDVVTYTGDGSGPRAISHNLGAAPDMIMLSGANSGVDRIVYHSANSTFAPQTSAWRLNVQGDNPQQSANYWNNTSPTSSTFTVGSTYNSSGVVYTVYLFREVPGFSRFYRGRIYGIGSFLPTDFKPSFLLNFSDSWGYGHRVFYTKQNSYGVNYLGTQLFISGAVAETSAEAQFAFQTSGVRVVNPIAFNHVDHFMIFAEAPLAYQPRAT